MSGQEMEKMYSDIVYRAGDEKTLLSEFLMQTDNNSLKFEVSTFQAHKLEEENVLALHYADGGAQGEPGLVAILYRTQQGVQILVENYIYGHLNLDILIQMFPMLKNFDNRHRLIPRSLSEENFELPEDWRYLYMGAMNHLFLRKELFAKAHSFIDAYLKNGGYSWRMFSAVAWLCQAKETDSD